MKHFILTLALVFTLGLTACGQVVIPRSASAVANDCQNLHKGNQKAIDKCLLTRRESARHMGM